MTKSQIVQFFKRNPLLLLLLLATLQFAAVFPFLNRQAQTSNAEPADSRPIPTASLPPSLAAAAPAPSPSPVAKQATKQATKQISQPTTASSPAQSTAAPSTKPALTPEQQALNQQYKSSFAASAAPVDTLIEMRVAIAEGVPSLTLSSSGGLTLLDPDRNPLNSLPAGTSYTIQPTASGISLNGTALPAAILLEPPSSGFFNLGDRTYRGKLLIINDGGELWAVNLVNLRHYLHSVVASEVSPSWPSEALKAQAVAARSYALTYYFKPMSSLFHLGATEYYQVYSGIGREAPEPSQAVDQTAGEFVSYRGGIVESLYAASDDIVAEAFQGRGMSQLGALNLAEQGYTYLQILANYYPKTGVSRFVSDYQ
jgi:stage II sporulation protein D